MERPMQGAHGATCVTDWLRRSTYDGLDASGDLGAPSPSVEPSPGHTNELTSQRHYGTSVHVDVSFTSDAVSSCRHGRYERRHILLIEPVKTARRIPYWDPIARYEMGHHEMQVDFRLELTHSTVT